MFVVADDDMSDAAPDDQVLGFADGPINGELLLDSTLSAELDALLRIDSSLDDFKSSFSRSSSLKKMQKVPTKLIKQWLNNKFGFIYINHKLT